MSKEKIIIGVLGGLAVGALLGILFAPNEGEETRKKISKKSGDAIDEIKERLSDLIKNFSGKLEAVKDEVESPFDMMKQEIKEVKKDLNSRNV